MHELKPLVIDSGAIFDSTGAYRYKLWRDWDYSLPRLTIIMLNPSRADAQKNDQTISTCMRVTKQFGFGGMDVVNLFAYCATDPRQLKIARNPVGRRNDEHIRKSINGSKTVLIAWGNGGRLYERSYRVLQLLFQARTNLICLGVTKMGEPRHPLYTRADLGWSSFNCVAE